MATLVTGANGFVGSAVAARLEDAILLTRDRADLSRPLPELPPADTVIHCAAELDDPARMHAVNVDGTRRLLEWASAHGVRTFVYLSTGGTAGVYGQTKREAEELVRGAGLHAQVLRLFFPYGPGQRPERLVPRLIASVRDGRPIAIGPGGGPRLSLTYVDDAAAAIVAASRNPEPGTSDLGGPAVSMRDLAATIGRILRREPRFEVRDTPSAGLIASPVLPGLPLEEGLRRCV